MKKITLWFSILFSWVIFNNATAQVEDFESTQVGQVPYRSSPKTCGV